MSAHEKVDDQQVTNNSKHQVSLRWAQNPAKKVLWQKIILTGRAIIRAEPLGQLVTRLWNPSATYSGLNCTFFQWDIFWSSVFLKIFIFGSSVILNVSILVFFWSSVFPNCSNITYVMISWYPSILALTAPALSWASLLGHFHLFWKYD